MDASFYACFGANDFFLNSRKIFTTQEMHSIALIKGHVNNWPQRTKRFNQLLKSKIQQLTASVGGLTYLPKLMQFRVCVHYIFRFARKTQLSLRDLCMYTHICTNNVQYNSNL